MHGVLRGDGTQVLPIDPLTVEVVRSALDDVGTGLQPRLVERRFAPLVNQVPEPVTRMPPQLDEVATALRVIGDPQRGGGASADGQDKPYGVPEGGGGGAPSRARRGCRQGGSP
jgi:hypothetical protein